MVICVQVQYGAQQPQLETDRAPHLPRCHRELVLGKDSRIQRVGGKEVAPLARALKNNVANAETQAQSINPFYYLVSAMGWGSFSLPHPLPPSSPPTPIHPLAPLLTGLDLRAMHSLQF